MGKVLSCSFHPLLHTLFPSISIKVWEKMVSFLPGFWGLPLKLRDSINHNSSLTKMYFVTGTTKAYNKGMLQIFWLQLIKTGEHYIVLLTRTFKTKVLCLHSIKLEVLSLDSICSYSEFPNKVFWYALKHCWKKVSRKDSWAILKTNKQTN